MVKQICTELSVHATIEEEIFYPACKGQIEDEDLLDESYVEHDGAKVLIAELMDSHADKEFYDAKVTVLSEMIKHHVKEEEKRSEGLFAQARDAGLDVDCARRADEGAQEGADGRVRPSAAAAPDPQLHRPQACPERAPGGTSGLTLPLQERTAAPASCRGCFVGGW